MKNLFFALLLIPFLSFGQSKFTTFECYDCRKIATGGKFLNSGSSGFLFDGIGVKERGGKEKLLSRPISVSWSGKVVYLSGSNNVSAKVEYNYSPYGNFESLLDSVIACAKPSDNFVQSIVYDSTSMSLTIIDTQGNTQSTTINSGVEEYVTSIDYDSASMVLSVETNLGTISTDIINVSSENEFITGIEYDSSSFILTATTNLGNTVSDTIFHPQGSSGGGDIYLTQLEYDTATNILVATLNNNDTVNVEITCNDTNLGSGTGTTCTPKDWRYIGFYEQPTTGFIDVTFSASGGLGDGNNWPFSSLATYRIVSGAAGSTSNQTASGLLTVDGILDNGVTSAANNSTVPYSDVIVSSSFNSLTGLLTVTVDIEDLETCSTPYLRETINDNGTVTGPTDQTFSEN